MSHSAPTPFTEDATVGAPAVTATSRPGTFRLMIGQKQAIVGFVILAVFVVMAIFAPLLEPYDPNAKTGEVYEAPNSSHVLGTDDAGADMLSLIIDGSRVSLIVGFAAALVATVIGGVIGLMAGYFGGKTDVTLMRITDYFIVIPDVPLMIVVAALFGRSPPEHHPHHRSDLLDDDGPLIRAQVKTVREHVYVKRAKSIGAGNTRIIRHHVLPQVCPSSSPTRCCSPPTRSSPRR